MKLNVAIETPGGDPCTVTVHAAPQDLVSAVCEKLASQQLFPFPETVLELKGTPLEPAATLGASGVRSCASGVGGESELCFRVVASEGSVARQLAALCDARALTYDELGLLYCYRHGISVAHALATLGVASSLADLVQRHPDLLEVGGKRVQARKHTAAADAPVAPVANVGNVGTGKENAPAATANVKKGKAKEAPKKEAKSDKKAKAKERVPRWSVSGEDLQELHASISSRSFHSRAAEGLSAVQEMVEAKCFLAIDAIVRAGSVGRGTAFVGGADAELVLFVRGLPATQHERWVPRVVSALAVALEGEARADAVVLGETTVRVSPVFDSYSQLVTALGRLGPESRPFFQASFAKEEAAFISKQPGYVKSLMRLLKWWRNQQTWSSNLTTPSDQVLELVAVWVSQQNGKTSLEDGLACCFEACARFKELRVVWGNFYRLEDVWAPLLAQRPLLMDPVNPFRNTADPQEFDPRELMALSKTTAFW